MYRYTFPSIIPVRLLRHHPTHPPPPFPRAPPPVLPPTKNNQIVFSFVSAVSSLFIIVTFWRFPRLHRFAYKIIVALAVSNLGLDVAYLMGEVGTDK